MSKPLELGSKEPMKIARAIAATVLGGELPRLLRVGEHWYAWKELVTHSRWMEVPPEWVFDCAALALEDACVLTVKHDDSGKTEVRDRLKPKVTDVREVVGFLETVCRHEGGMPAWVGKKPKGAPSADELTAFADRLVWIDGSKPPEWVTFERDERWFGLAVAPAAWDPKAKCPEWERSMKRWLDGEQSAVELRERFYGDLLRAHRCHGYALYEYGETKAGKGIGTRLLQAALGGAPSYYGTRMEVVSGEFGQDGLERAQVTVVGELHGDLRRGVGDRLGSLIKTILGWDTTTLNAKHVRLRQVEYQCGLILQGNPLVRLPDDKKSLSGKLLFLYFGASALGAEDLGLETRLHKELAGIMLRWCEAAWRLGEAKAGERWPKTEAGTAIQLRLEQDTHPVDSFVGAAFERSPRWFVTGDVVGRQRAVWKAATGLDIERENGNAVSDLRLCSYIEEHLTGGGVTLCRRKNKRGLQGLKPLQKLRL
jgi:hypothetical protein